MLHDLLISGGTVVDGTGGPRFVADIAVRGGKIAAVGANLGAAREQIDATGLLVTPGFVDVHTHYDGQVTWDTKLAPLVWHGVTTAVIGNCGVGFAPARLADREYLINLMSSVEDIPARSLAAGMEWAWETYPEYLDAVAAKPRTIDIASMVTHCSLRVYVMGERAAAKPTPKDIEMMCDLAREAVRAGAVGLSTSRTILHTTADGKPVPGTDADETELTALARAVREGGGGRRGVLEVSPPGVAFAEPVDLVQDIDRLICVARSSGCPVVFSLLQSNHKPEDYLAVLDRVSAAARDGVVLHPEVSTRPTATLISFQSLFNPFANSPAFAPLKNLGFEQRIIALRNPSLRQRLVREINPNPTGLDLVFTSDGFWSQVFITGSPFNYYPAVEDSVQALADRAGVDPREIAYDAMLDRDGRAFLMYATCNWANRNRKPLYDMIAHPSSLLGLGDGGAHVTVAGDFSQPTTVLTGWVRDVSCGDNYRLTLEEAIRKLSLANAQAFGLSDRGALKPGLKADINLIDFGALAIGDPVMESDLPLGLPRLDQRASGYAATFVSGIRIQAHGRLSGNLPGSIARGN
jgi:N-acyl-D-aspartate/D-glutamate deacylase